LVQTFCGRLNEAPDPSLAITATAADNASEPLRGTGERVFVIAPLAAKPPLENARRYDELASGRMYVESDPIGLQAGVDTYTYAAGNPLSLNDPLGLEAVAELNRLGWGINENDYGYHPPVKTPDGTKAKICALLKSCNGDKQCAYNLALKTRKANLPESWQNLEDREVENWIAIVNWPQGMQAQIPKIDFYEAFVKQNLRGIYHTTPYSSEAWGNSLDAVTHKNDTSADLAKWCNDCAK
jgi:hypothetical protein